MILKYKKKKVREGNIMQSQVFTSKKFIWQNDVMLGQLIVLNNLP